MSESNKIRSCLMKMVVFCAIAFFIEAGICNFRTWESMAWTPSNLIEMDAFLLKDGQYLSLEDKTSVIAPFREDGWCDVTAFSGNMQVKNVYLLCRYLDASNQPIDSSYVTVYMKIRDEGNALSYQVPDRVIVPEIPRTQYNRLNPSGNLKGLELTFLKPDNRDIAAVEIQNCVFNKTVPLQISGIRFIILFSLIIFIYYLRPGSSIYNIQFGWDFSWKKWAAAGCVMVCIAIPLFFANIDPQYRNGRTQYHDLTEALLNGHAYLDEVPAKALAEMDNPYDAWLRDQIMRDSGESWRLDWAYYNGKYYVYFGIVPVLLNFLPYYVLTGTHLPVPISVSFFGVLYILGCFTLLWFVFKKNFKEAPFVTYLLSCLMLVFGSGMFYAFRYPAFYGLPIIAAAAFAVWGLWFWYRAVDDASKNIYWGSVMSGSLCIALIAGCRPQFLIVSIASLIIFRSYLFEKDFYHTGGGHIFNKSYLLSKRGIVFLTAWIMPVLIVAVFIMYYNFIRFGSPFDFGANYNLTSNDMTHRGWHWDRTVLGIYIYLFDPTKISGVFPFILDSVMPSASAIHYTNYMGITTVEGPYGGIIFNHPILILPFLSMKLKKYCEKGIYKMSLFFVTAAMIVVVVDTQMAGLVGRYLMDFGWMLCLAATLLYSSIEKSSNDHTLKVLIRTGILISVIWGIIYEIMLAFNGSMRASLPDLYYGFQAIVEFWL